MEGNVMTQGINKKPVFSININISISLSKTALKVENAF